MKVVVANAKQFGQQFAITIQTGGHVLFSFLVSELQREYQTKPRGVACIWDCGVERSVFMCIMYVGAVV